jgi:hypothetical protein
LLLNKPYIHAYLSGELSVQPPSQQSHHDLLNNIDYDGDFTFFVNFFRQNGLPHEQRRLCHFIHGSHINKGLKFSSSQFIEFNYAGTTVVLPHPPLSSHNFVKNFVQNNPSFQHITSSISFENNFDKDSTSSTNLEPFKSAHLSIKAQGICQSWSRPKFIPIPHFYSNGVKNRDHYDPHHQSDLSSNTGQKAIHQIDKSCNIWYYLHDVPSGCINTSAPNYKMYALCLFILLFPHIDCLGSNQNGFQHKNDTKFNFHFPHTDLQKCTMLTQQGPTVLSTSNFSAQNPQKRPLLRSEGESHADDVLADDEVQYDNSKLFLYSETQNGHYGPHCIKNGDISRSKSVKKSPYRSDLLSSPPVQLVDTRQNQLNPVHALPQDYKGFTKTEFIRQKAQKQYSFFWHNRPDFNQEIDPNRLIFALLKSYPIQSFQSLGFIENKIQHFAKKRQNISKSNQTQTKRKVVQNSELFPTKNQVLSFLIKTVLFLKQQTLEQYFDVLIPYDTNSLEFYQQFIDQCPSSRRFHDPNPTIITKSNEKLNLPTFIKLPLPMNEVIPRGEYLYSDFTLNYNPLSIPTRYLDKTRYEQVIFTPPAQEISQVMKINDYKRPCIPIYNNIKVNNGIFTKGNYKIQIPRNSPLEKLLIQEAHIHFAKESIQWLHAVRNFVDWSIESQIKHRGRGDYQFLPQFVKNIGDSIPKSDQTQDQNESNESIGDYSTQNSEEKVRKKRDNDRRNRIIPANYVPKTEKNQRENIGPICESWAEAREKTRAGKLWEATVTKKECPECQFVTANTGALFFHILTHTGELPFEYVLILYCINYLIHPNVYCVN